MKYVLSPKVIRLGEIVAKIPFAKMLLKPIYYPYKDWLNKKRNKQFLQYGLETLEKFDRTLNKNGVDYVLGFGTLLGAVRNHGFLSHDLDIDTCMWCEDYYNHHVQELLEKAGFEMLRRFEVDEGKAGMEVTFVLNDVSIDIFLIYSPVNELPYTCHNWDPYGETTSMEQSMKKYGKLIPWRFEAPYNHDIVRTKFYESNLPIPSNYDEILSYRYGDDYMTPNPGWIDDRRNMVEWPEKDAIKID